MPDPVAHRQSDTLPRLGEEAWQVKGSVTQYVSHQTVITFY